MTNAADSCIQIIVLYTLNKSIHGYHYSIVNQNLEK